jgi:hypothetical protein
MNIGSDASLPREYSVAPKQGVVTDVKGGI